ncbi:hypothetical protein KY290_014905 [Solanum tuberosum]|uniref:chitinase n=1 Tax=Solanum tuberosum TaxID=4113 RepID=A0ABQ7VT43_SOLTU|nr:hypothetical protein KY285_015438 [Solanum tuberosum]KAH0770924.1 hypothetical protein KY290_014905 [Solanum tuberosum]
MEFLGSQMVLCCVFLLFLTGSLAQDVGTIVTSDLFNEMLKNRNDDRCPAKGFYTYDAFIAAANSFPGFGTTGDDTARKKEIAAFLVKLLTKLLGNTPSANRQPGYGVITNIINGGIECGKGQNPQVEDRIGFYRRYCTILNGDNLDCYTQRNFAEA